MATELAAYIEHDLKRRIHAGGDMPTRLTLAALAEVYGVSVTPVCAAVSRLIADGCIQKGPTGRLSVNESRLGTGTAPEVIDTPRAPDDWDRIVIQDVMRASLGREGTYLREEALARHHDVGRSIIRQVLTRLAGAGLLQHIPRCGWRVHPCREEDVLDFLDVREALELKALDLARGRLCPDELRRILAANPVPEPGTPPRLNNELHGYLIQQSGNRYLCGFFSQYVARYYTALFDYAAPEASVVVEMAGQHRRILQALIARSWGQARDALAEHIQAQARVLNALLRT